METIITAATIMAMYFNLSNQNSNSFYYNSELDNNQVKNVEVYSSSDKMLRHSARYSFEYDSQSRILSKTTQEWNDMTNAWVNNHKYEYAYNDNGYTLTLSNWDVKAEKYTPSGVMVQYEMLGDDIVAVNTYKYSTKSHDYEMADNILLFHPTDELLLAQAENMTK